MGNVDGVPIASQVKSIVQATRGDSTAAWETQNRFTERCVGAAQVRSVVELARGDIEAAASTQMRFLENTRRLLDTSEVADALPVVAQLKSVAYVADGRVQEAADTQRNFSMHCPVVAQVRSVLEAATGHTDEAVETQREFMRFASRALDKVPVLGHAKALLHLSLGDGERGEEAFNEATRVTLRGGQLLGSALNDIFGSAGSSTNEQAAAVQDPFRAETVCAAAGPLSPAEVREHTLCLEIAREQVRSHKACPICMSDFEVRELVTTLRCFHLFHAQCASRF